MDDGSQPPLLSPTVTVVNAPSAEVVDIDNMYWPAETDSDRESETVHVSPLVIVPLEPDEHEIIYSPPTFDSESPPLAEEDETPAVVFLTPSKDEQSDSDSESSDSVTVEEPVMPKKKKKRIRPNTPETARQKVARHQALLLKRRKVQGIAPDSKPVAAPAPPIVRLPVRPPVKKIEPRPALKLPAPMRKEELLRPMRRIMDDYWRGYITDKGELIVLFHHLIFMSSVGKPFNNMKCESPVTAVDADTWLGVLIECRVESLLFFLYERAFTPEYDLAQLQRERIHSPAVRIESAKHELILDCIIAYCVESNAPDTKEWLQTKRPWNNGKDVAHAHVLVQAIAHLGFICSPRQIAIRAAFLSQCVRNYDVYMSAIRGHVSDSVLCGVEGLDQIMTQQQFMKMASAIQNRGGGNSLLITKMMQGLIFQSDQLAKSANVPLFTSVVDSQCRSTMSLLQLMVDIVVQRPVGSFVSLWLASHRLYDNITIQNALMSAPMDYLVRLNGLWTQLEWSIRDYLYPRNTARIAVGEKLTELIGLETYMPFDNQLAVVEEGTAFLPVVALGFHSWEDYIIRTMALYKAAQVQGIIEDYTCRFVVKDCPVKDPLGDHFKRRLDENRLHTLAYRVKVDIGNDKLPTAFAIADYTSIDRYTGTLTLKWDDSWPIDSRFEFENQKSSVLLLSGMSSKGPFLRGCQFVQLKKQEKGMRSLAVRIDEAFAVWHEGEPDCKFIACVPLDPQLQAYIHVLESLRELVISPPDFWLQRMLLGTLRPNDVRSSQMVSPDSQPPGFDCLGAFKNQEELVAVGNYWTGKNDVVVDKNGGVAIGYQKQMITQPLPRVVGFGGSTNPFDLDSTGNLYPAQQRALFSAMFHRVTVIEGPPGTGKTRTAIAIAKVLESSLRSGGQREPIAIAAQSNYAVDLIVEALAGRGVPDGTVLRLGNMSRCTNATAQKCTLAALKAEASNRFVKSLNEAQLFESDVDEWRSTVTTLTESVPANIHKLYNEKPSERQSFMTAVESFAEYMEKIWMPRNRAKSAMCACATSIIAWGRIASVPPTKKGIHIVKGARFICMTCNGAAMYRTMLDGAKVRFSVIITEEAGRMLEAEMLTLLRYKPRRIIMVGDDKQLSPIVRGNALKKTGIDQTLLRRLLRLGLHRVQLDRQGRAQPIICDLYRWRYTESPLLDLDHVKSIEFCKSPPGLLSPLQFIDIATFGSRPNPQFETSEIEGDYIMAFVSYLIHLSRVNMNLISVLTPYQRQKQLLKRKMESILRGRVPKWMVATTDEFQGKENDIIIISMVAGARGTLSDHMRDAGRISVLTSRARKSLYIVGYRHTYEMYSEWKNVMNVFNSHINTSGRELVILKPRRIAVKRIADFKAKSLFRK